MARSTRAAKHSMAQQCTPRSLPALIMAICVASLFYLPSVTSQSAVADSCSNGLNLGSLVPFNTTGLTCFQAWPSQDFILRFGKASGSNVWSFVLSAPDNGGYISMGFSLTGRMVGSSAVAGWAGSARQYYLGGTSSGSCPPDKGDLALARGATVAVSKGSRLYLAFQLTGKSPLTDVIYAVGPSGTLPGSNGLLPRHQDMASGTISLSGGGTGGAGGGSPATGGGGDGDGDDEGGEGKGAGKSSGEGSGEGGEDEKGERRTSPASASISGGGGGAFLTSKRRHGVLAVVSWGVLVPLGVALARFCKRFDPFWFYAHVVAQGLGCVIGAVAIAAGFKLDADEVGAHKAIGVAVVVGAGLQATALLARPAKETKARRYWNWYHHGVGRVAVALGVANVFYGFSLASERQEWSYVYGIFIGIFAVVFLVLEEWRRTH